ncbi:unnamed protein product [Clonostachys rosea]|uniref:Nephrocystin 3-like N-terminal domain-containing protein n=1 Tax=Bionectria ochroleuca TaxID=29856 RepID=A0ABY6V3T7_BIOOC|nr:unnamed protein product [Clonostachys rosea]
MKHYILDTGISVAYEPENVEPIVDFVFVHGLHGHPYKSWTRSNRDKDGRENLLRRAIARLGRSSSNSSPEVASQTTLNEADGTEKAPEAIFWPADLLPLECPNSRILMYGYDSKITKYTSGAANKSSLLSHSKDLLFSLARHGVHNRHLVFVAHSLGGIIVKELQMLGRSSSSAEDGHRNIVESTAAVIFLGTPHRGSPEFAAIGETLRSIVSSLGMDTTPANLDALGLKNTDLERAQEAFSTIWNKYDFKVKTFQESLSMSGIRFGGLENKVVPGHSSAIGDVREHAETLQANHKDMSRYSGLEDPNYRKVGGELSSLYRSLVNLNLRPPVRAGQKSSGGIRQQSGDSKTSNEIRFDPATKTQMLDMLWSPEMHSRYQDIAHPADNTCSWLFNNQMYQDWYSDKNCRNHSGLLWLKGKPGTGKSVLMKEAFLLAVRDGKTSDHLAASFFFNKSGGTDLSCSESALFRSLLHQLLLKSDGLFLLWRDKLQEESATLESLLCKPKELKHFFQYLAQSFSKRIILYIDALDESDSENVREQAYFWREITTKARKHGSQLSVCLSSRHFPNVFLADCSEIIMEENNLQDIHQYINDRFRLVNSGEIQEFSNAHTSYEVSFDYEEEQEKILKDKIYQKSEGVFLWAALVVEEVLRDRDDGKGLPYLLRKIRTVPSHLKNLFTDLLRYDDAEERRVALRLFRWAVLSVSPLRLYEWHHILAFIRCPSLSSLSEWRRNIHFTRTDNQLEKQIRSISRGLVEVRRIQVDEPYGVAFDSLSLHAGAGSLNLESGGTRVIQVIHESVREFFLRENGFAVLDLDLTINPIGYAHLDIMKTCLNYINIHELDALVDARNRMRRFPDKGTSSAKQAVSQLDEASQELEKDGLNERPIDGSSLTGPKKPPKFDNRTVNREILTSKVLEMTQAQVFPIDIHLWMSTNNSALGDLSTGGTPALSVANSSISGLSQRLEDHPALLSYATQKFFIHAKLADLSYTDPREILRRLLNLKVWSRLKSLREDIPFDIQLLEYAAQFGLISWVSTMLLSRVSPPESHEIIAKVHSEDNYKRLALNCSPIFDDRRRLSQFIINDFKKTFPRFSEEVSIESKMRDGSSFLKDWAGPEYPDAVDHLGSSHPWGTARRQRSIESFGSASSHSGSIHGELSVYDDGSLGDWIAYNGEAFIKST